MIALTLTPTFEQRIEHELVQGSAIASELFESAIEFIEDTGRWETYQALGFDIRTQWQTRKPHDFGILAALTQETGDPWQFKPEHPLTDSKGKTQKYQTAKGNGSRAFLPAIPLKVWRQISRRHELPLEAPWQRVLDALKTGCQIEKSCDDLTPDGRQSKGSAIEILLSKFQALPANNFKGFATNLPQSIAAMTLSQWQSLMELSSEELRSSLKHLPSNTLVPDFWGWVAGSGVSLVWTEGGKKALCLLSLGYVAIALTGVNGGYRADGSLIPDVARFAQPGRQHAFAFDRDGKSETRRKVDRAIAKFGRLLEATGGAVSVAIWDGYQGKGVDDLVVQQGAAAWESAYVDALPLLHWQLWQRLENRLTWQPSIKVHTHDLSTLSPDQFPQSGIIAIAAGKGTGKTKLSARLVAGEEKVLAANHRIALCRNICERLNLDYRGDLDKTPDGQFITGAGYTLRVGSCVDALLAIDPHQFAGCTLVIDEAVQVIRHLLTSSTCSQDGKRPALLARFHELVCVARRLILADADLDNATLHYFKELRGDDSPVFLIRNDYQTQPYPVRAVQANSFESVACEVLNDLHQLQPGKTLFVATDNKRVTKAISRLIANSCPEKRVLIINSETSGGEAEREFIQTPDAVLQRGEYDIIIASPSLATGVSIEAQGIISRVYGIFTGVSSNDADISQSLARIREPVERVVWVAKRGRNWAKVSRSTNPLAIKQALLEQTSVNVSLIRSSLKEDTIASVQAVDWQSDPHLNLYCQIAAAQNRSMHQLRDAVLVRLRHEGHHVTIEDREYDPVARFLYRQAATEQKRHDAQAIANAKVLTYLEVKVLEQQESRSPEDELAIKRFYLCEFYCLDPDSLTPEFILWDADGRRRGELLNLEGLLNPDAAIDSTVKALEKQTTWNKGNCPWDISGAALRSEVRRLLGLDKFLDPEREWRAADLAEFAAIARQHSRQIQDVLHFTASEKLSNVQIAHQLLSQLGLKIAFRWQGTGKEKHRVYRLDAQCWQKLTDILNRRQERRSKIAEAQAEEGSPPSLINQKPGGDPKPQNLPDLEKWLSPDSIADIKAMWQQANTPEMVEEVRRIIPLEVLEIAIAS